LTTRASAKKFPGGGSTKKRPKIAKKSTIKPLPGGWREAATEKDRKIAKKTKKSFSIYENPEGATLPLLPAADAHA